MSKALIIKGANFAANKIETIVVSDTVPCTGIALSQSTMTATALGVAGTLTATVTPADTTEAVTWASSNTDVATVAEGVVTITGVGSATITATCGSQSATAEVTSTITINANTLHATNGQQLASTNLTVNPPKNYASLYAYEKGRVYSSDVATASGYRAFAVDTNYTYPIMLPKNTGSVIVTAPASFNLAGKICLFDSTQKQTYIQEFDDVALAKEYTTGINPTSGVYTFNISDTTVDSYVIQIGTDPGPAQDVTGDVTITYTAAS